MCPEEGPGHFMGVLLSLMRCSHRHEHTKFYLLQPKLCYLPVTVNTISMLYKMSHFS